MLKGYEQSSIQTRNDPYIRRAQYIASISIFLTACTVTIRLLKLVSYVSMNCTVLSFGRYQMHLHL
jgi:hypothetical protein